MVFPRNLAAASLADFPMRRAPWDRAVHPPSPPAPLPLHSSPSGTSSSRRVSALGIRAATWPDSELSPDVDQSRARMRTEIRKFLRNLLAALVVGSAVYYAYMQIADPIPFSGRRRGPLIPLFIEKYYAGLSCQMMLSEYAADQFVPHDHEAYQHIKEVGTALVEAAGLGDLEWKFVLVHSDVPNAMVFPNGTCVVFTGLVPIMKDANGAATVLGHEVAHVLARHGGEDMTRLSVLGGLYLLMQPLLYATGAQELILELLLQLIWKLPHSRSVEHEADLIGLHIMHRAGFDVSTAHHIWERMLEAAPEGELDLTIFSTHPPTTERSERIQEIAKEILKTVPGPEKPFALSDRECPPENA